MVMMSSRATLLRTCASLAAGAFLAGAASIAHAEPARKADDFTVRMDQSASSVGGNSLTWDARKGRWGMTFNGLAGPEDRWGGVHG
jgi:hypothetical protein